MMIRKTPLFSRPKTIVVPAPPRVGWFRRVFGWLKAGVRRLCIVLGFFVLLSFFAGVVTGVKQGGDDVEALPEKFILTLRMQDGLIEDGTEGADIFSALGTTVLTTHRLIDAIEDAAGDDRVRALAITLEGGDYPMPAVQELRTAIAHFRESGRPAVVFSPSFADVDSRFGAYYLAAAFDEIWMQPAGMLFLTGIDTEMPYMRGALEKIGVSGQYFQRKEYKNAFENVTSDTMSPATEEMMSALIADMIDQLANDLAADREMDRAEIMRHIDTGLLTDEEALNAGLMDRIGFGNEMMAALREKLGETDEESIPTVDMDEYAGGAQGDWQSIIAHYAGVDDAIEEGAEDKPQIALISVTGLIVPMSAHGGPDLWGGDTSAGADRVAGAIMKAARDDDIDAIVMRIDSPGGSPSASETIRHATQFAREKGKPVIVSMGTMAGSGGYWIATNASQIFALPTTMTGSIGVIAGKFEMAGLWEKIGVNWEGLSVGENADMWSLNKPFDDAAQERMNAMTDRIYELFVQRVAEGRNMTPEEVEVAARGRVWTGRQAQRLGLVDTLGGLNDALDFAAVEIGAGSRHDADVVRIPRATNPFDRFMESLGIEAAMPPAITAFLDPLARAMEPAQIPGGVAAYDPLMRGLNP